MLNRLRDSLDQEKLITRGVALVVVFLVLYPVYWIVDASFRVDVLEPGYTLKWYATAFGGEFGYVLRLLVNSVVFAGGGTLIALLVGLGFALLVARTDLPGRRVLGLLFIAPFFLSPMITAIAWTLLASPRIGLINAALRSLFGVEGGQGPFNIFTPFGMVLVLGLYLSPYVYLFASSALRGVDPSLEEASRLGGRSAGRTIATVTLPLIRPAILSAALICLVLGLGQFGIPSILGIPARTYVLTTAIYANMSGWPSQREYAAVLSAMLLAVALVAIYLQRRALGGRSYVTITARGFRPPFVELGRWRWPVAVAAWGVVGFISVLPVLALVWASFARRWTTHISFDLVTLDHYLNLTDIDPAAWFAIRNSLVLSLLAASIALAISVAVATVIVKERSWFARGLEYVAMLPAAIPGIVFAVGLLAAYIRPPLVLYGTAAILLVAYVTEFIPVGMRACGAALRQLDPALEEAARMGGASWLRRMRKVVLPLIRPAMVGGWVLIFVTLMKEFSSSVLLGSPAVPVNATVLWGFWSLGHYGALSAFEVVNTLIMAAIAGIALMFDGRRRPAGAG